MVVCQGKQKKCSVIQPKVCVEMLFYYDLCKYTVYIFQKWLLSEKKTRKTKTKQGKKKLKLKKSLGVFKLPNQGRENGFGATKRPDSS